MASTRLYGPSPAPQTSGGVVPANTQGGNVAPLPAKQSVTGTSETVIVNPAITLQALILSIPPNSPLEQKEFAIDMSGYVTTTQSSTFTLGIRIGTSTTAASNTAMATSGASGSIATTTVPFRFKATCVFDSVSGKITGSVSGVLGGTLVTSAVLTSAPITPTPVINNTPASPGTTGGAAVISFVPTVTFATGATANVINVQEFAITF